MRKGWMLILKKIWSKYSQWRSFSESKPIPCTNSFREKRLASCMANLSKFHAVFSSSTLIRLDKDAFEGLLCQTVNNFVKQNKSSLLSPLRKRRPPQHIKNIRNTRVSWIPTFDQPCSSTLHPLKFVTVVFLVWVPNSGVILHRRVNQRKVSSLLNSQRSQHIYCFSGRGGLQIINMHVTSKPVVIWTCLRHHLKQNKITLLTIIDNTTNKKIYIKKLVYYCIIKKYIWKKNGNIYFTKKNFF